MNEDLKSTIIERSLRIWEIVKEPIERPWDRTDYNDKTPAVSNPRRQSRRLTDEDVESFMDAAETREDPMWESIEQYLTGPLWMRSPTRAKMLRQEIRWMRRMAAKDGLEWGSYD